MKYRHKKIISVVLICLLGASLIWHLTYNFTFISADAAHIIFSNPITYSMQRFYDNFFSPLICIFISFVNLCYAIMGLRKNYKSQETSKKLLAAYYVYTIISFIVLVIHCISFCCIFGHLVAGWFLGEIIWIKTNIKTK